MGEAEWVRVVALLIRCNLTLFQAVSKEADSALHEGSIVPVLRSAELSRGSVMALFQRPTGSEICLITW